MIPIILAVILGGFGVIVFAILLYARWNYTVLESMPFPVVKPHMFLGSDPEGYKKILQLEDLKRFKKFGPIFGVYEGRTPRVFICDPELIRLITVKDFEHFHDRTPFETGDRRTNELLDFLPGEKWKLIRFTMTPLFTPIRIKQMAKTIQVLTDEYVNDATKGFSGKRFKINMRDFMSPLMVEIIGKVFFNTRVENINDPNNFLMSMMKFFSMEDYQPTRMQTALESFPILYNFLPMPPNPNMDKFEKFIEDILDARRKSGIKENDFIDILQDMITKCKSLEYKNQDITEVTVMIQALLVFVAGYDAVNATVTLLAYHLAKHAQVQEKVLVELDKVIKAKFNGTVDHTDLEELTYLSACMDEVLRLYPPFPRTERMCTKSWTHNNLTIPKGMSVLIPTWAVNRNPDVYTDPELFDPDRFLPKNRDNLNSYAQSAFGFGPRNCLGMRLARDIVKLVICRFLTEYQFQIRNDTELVWVPGLSMSVVKFKPIMLDFVPREK